MGLSDFAKIFGAWGYPRTFPPAPYSRYPAEQWEEEILKMKAGGVNVVPTYVFWSLHEEVEGQYRWDGQRNLRGFIELCKKHDMPVIVRIGPWCHGEIRSGGFPDWLFA